jgi:hypothetical protein
MRYIANVVTAQVVRGFESPPLRHFPGVCGLVRALLLGLGLSLAACTTPRTLSIESDPPGALVQLDGRQIGRTPLMVQFHHHGDRRVTLTRPGFQVWSERISVHPPWHARFPADLFTELLWPFELSDDHRLMATLVRESQRLDEPDLRAIVQRASAMRTDRDTPAAEALLEEQEQ